MSTHPFHADAHLAPWLQARFGLTVVRTDDMDFMAFEGDYDLDCGTGTDSTIFAAAMDYASGYDSALFDKLANIETGEVA